MATTFERPFPALTPEQRYSLDLNGYVVINDVLSRDECGVILDALQKLKRDLKAIRAEGPCAAHGATTLTNQPHYISMEAILQVDPALTAYAFHPRLVGMAEELIGGEARLVEFNAIINRRVSAEPIPSGQYGFHRGTDIPYSSHIKNGLYHCNFVKTLTNLTDLDGPQDGGTVCIAGSHKIDAPQDDVIAAAYADRSLIHQVVAPAGSTLLFSETVIHSAGNMWSDKERAIIIGGYGASMMPWWDGGQLTPEFTEAVPEQYRTLLFGRAHWNRRAKYRTLADPVDERQFTLADSWWFDPALKAL